MLPSLALATLAAATLVAAVATAFYFLRARVYERVEASLPDAGASEVRALGERIESLVGQQQLHGETQRQILGQKLDAIAQRFDEQRHAVDGLRMEVRSETQRRDAEIAEIRHQIAAIQQATTALPPHAPARPALAAEAPLVVDGALPPEMSPVPEPWLQELPAAVPPAIEQPATDSLPVEALAAFSDVVPDSFRVLPSDESAPDTPPARPVPMHDVPDLTALPLGDGAAPPPTALPPGVVVDRIAEADDDPFGWPVPPLTPSADAAPTSPSEAAPVAPAAPPADAFGFLFEDPFAAPPAAPPPAPAPAPAPPAEAAWVSRPDRTEATPTPFAADTLLGGPSVSPAVAPPPVLPPPPAPPPPVAAAPMPPVAEFAIPEDADDLTVISSVDETVQRALYLAGVTKLEEIARWGRGDARRISQAVEVSEDLIMGQWIFEAQAALFDQYTRQTR